MACFGGFGDVMGWFSRYGCVCRWWFAVKKVIALLVSPLQPRNNSKKISLGACVLVLDLVSA